MSESLKERFGDDLDNMLRVMIDKEVKKHEAEFDDKVEEVKTRIEGFMVTMASINKMFATLESDMNELEGECKITEQLMDDKGNSTEVIIIDDADNTDNKRSNLGSALLHLQADMKELKTGKDVIEKQILEVNQTKGAGDGGDYDDGDDVIAIEDSNTTQTHTHTNLDRQRASQVDDDSPSTSIVSRKSVDFKPGTDSLKIGLVVWARYKDQWVKATIIDIITYKDSIKYKVKYKNRNIECLLRSNHLACADTTFTAMPFGCRVAARFKDDGVFSGIIAESADENLNRGRYLVFFDDGYAIYCATKHVYLVYDYPADVWTDIRHKPTANYIRTFLSQQTERPMLHVKEGQTLKVEFEGEWHRARCVRVDCSLVEVLYLSDNNRELIYRGSMRLSPLWWRQRQQNEPTPEKSNSKRRMARAHTGMRKAHVEYATIDLTGDDSFSVKSPESKPNFETIYHQRSNSWEAPWSRPLHDHKSSQTAATKLPQSYSELSGQMDIASHIFNRLEQSEKEQQFARSRKNANRNSVSDGNRKDGSNIPPPRDGVHSVSFQPHDCQPECFDLCRSKAKHKLEGVSLLLQPMALGWSREVSRINKSGCHVYYRTPCGRSCRNMTDIERYFKECKITQLDFDNFSFDHTVKTNNKYVVKSPDAKWFIRDYTGGKENVAVSCVNEINLDKPPDTLYTSERVPGKGVKINTNTDFMLCCDCPDNCRDRSKCPCQQLTVQATSCSRNATIKKDAGYEYKRLYSFLHTGVYECNSKCKCNKQCLNRVVQNGLKYRLQLFKTFKKGWGIRTLDDIANGSFVCVYTGKIETESHGESEAVRNGDEYLAELDHIEVAESIKHEYNENESSGVESMSEESDNEASKKPSVVKRTQSRLDEDDLHEKKSVTKKKFGYSTSPVELNEVVTVKKKRLVKRDNVSPADDSPSSDTSIKVRSLHNDSDTTDTDPEPDLFQSASKFNFAQTKNRESDESSEEQEANQTRKHFGGGGIYIIDAKQTGNLGRFLNHSCSPNLMVQNVFIDTHDLRFPWVAFFARCTIKAGTELTWDYNYDVGSVPGRVMYCYCGSTKCRKRLL